MFKKFWKDLQTHAHTYKNTDRFYIFHEQHFLMYQYVMVPFFFNLSTIWMLFSDIMLLHCKSMPLLLLLWSHFHKCAVLFSSSVFWLAKGLKQICPCSCRQSIAVLFSFIFYFILAPLAAGRFFVVVAVVGIFCIKTLCVCDKIWIGHTNGIKIFTETCADSECIGVILQHNMLSVVHSVLQRVF